MRLEVFKGVTESLVAARNPDTGELSIYQTNQLIDNFRGLEEEDQKLASEWADAQMKDAINECNITRAKAFLMVFDSFKRRRKTTI